MNNLTFNKDRVLSNIFPLTIRKELINFWICFEIDYNSLIDCL